MWFNVSINTGFTSIIIDNYHYPHDTKFIFKNINFNFQSKCFYNKIKLCIYFIRKFLINFVFQKYL